MPKPTSKSNPKLARSVQNMLRGAGLPDTSKVVISPAKKGKKGK
jgi:hypothetical protein